VQKGIVEIFLVTYPTGKRNRVNQARLQKTYSSKPIDSRAELSSLNTKSLESVFS